MDVICAMTLAEKKSGWRAQSVCACTDTHECYRSCSGDRVLGVGMVCAGEWGVNIRPNN